jgi:hypothetical protein
VFKLIGDQASLNLLLSHLTDKQNVILGTLSNDQFLGNVKQGFDELQHYLLMINSDLMMGH